MVVLESIVERPEEQRTAIRVYDAEHIVEDSDLVSVVSDCPPPSPSRPSVLLSPSPSAASLVVSRRSTTLPAKFLQWTKKQAGFLKDLWIYPFKNEIDFRVEVNRVVSCTLLWMRVELFWSVALFVLSGWYLYFVLGNMTEEESNVERWNPIEGSGMSDAEEKRGIEYVPSLRERLSGWLIFMIIILTCRIISLSMIIEELKWFRDISHTHDIKQAFIALLYSNRMTVSRSFYIIYFIWWYVIPIHLIKEEELLVGSAVNGNASYAKARMILWYISHVSLSVLLVFESAIILINGLLFLYKQKLYTTHWDQILYNSRENNSTTVLLQVPLSQTNLGPRAPAAVASIPKQVLKTFPLIQFPAGLVAETDATKDETSDLMLASPHFCTVCLSLFVEGETLRVLPCAHLFHRECIDVWLAEKVNCPFRCETDLSKPFDVDSFSKGDGSRLLPQSIVHLILLAHGKTATLRGGAGVSHAAVRVGP